MDGILGGDTRLVQPPLSMDDYHKQPLGRSRSTDTDDRRNLEQALVSEGVHRRIDVDFAKAPPDMEDGNVAFSPATPSKRKSNHPASSIDHESPSPTSPRRSLHAHPQDHRPLTSVKTWPINKPNDHGKGHAHDPREDHPFVGIGPSSDYQPNGTLVVSESPPTSDIDIYETAYQESVERIRERQGRSATLFLTRRVDRNPEFCKDEDLIRSQSVDGANAVPQSGISKMLELARKKKAEKEGGGGDTLDRTST